MALQPYYTAETINSCYRLRYVWVGWPKKPQKMERPPEDVVARLRQRWEGDGIRLLEATWSPTEIKILSSVRPTVSPTDFAARIKGRLQYELRKAGRIVKFRRKFSVRTIGENRRKAVEEYVLRQVTNASFADARFEKFLEQFTVANEAVDLSKSARSSHGAYWYNLHLVFVVRRRAQITDSGRLSTLRDWCFRIADVKGYEIATLSVMPDHLHVALRGHYEHSAEAIALAFMNNLAYAVRQRALWMPSYYVGSFGEYTMGAIRSRVGQAHLRAT